MDWSNVLVFLIYFEEAVGGGWEGPSMMWWYSLWTFLLESSHQTGTPRAVEKKNPLSASFFFFCLV